MAFDASGVWQMIPPTAQKRRWSQCLAQRQGKVAWVPSKRFLQWSLLVPLTIPWVNLLRQYAQGVNKTDFLHIAIWLPWVINWKSFPHNLWLWTHSEHRVKFVWLLYVLQISGSISSDHWWEWMQGYGETERSATHTYEFGLLTWASNTLSPQSSRPSVHSCCIICEARLPDADAAAFCTGSHSSPHQKQPHTRDGAILDEKQLCL